MLGCSQGHFTATLQVTAGSTRLMGRKEDQEGDWLGTLAQSSQCYLEGHSLKWALDFWCS